MIGIVGGPGGRVFSRLPINRTEYSRKSTMLTAGARINSGGIFGRLDVTVLLHETEVAATCYGMNKCSSGCMAAAYRRLPCMLPGDLISPRGLACSEVSAKSILP